MKVDVEFMVEGLPGKGRFSSNLLTKFGDVAHRVHDRRDMDIVMAGWTTIAELQEPRPHVPARPSAHSISSRSVAALRRSSTPNAPEITRRACLGFGLITLGSLFTGCQNDHEIPLVKFPEGLPPPPPQVKDDKKSKSNSTSQGDPSLYTR